MTDYPYEEERAQELENEERRELRKISKDESEEADDAQESALLFFNRDSINDIRI